MKSLAWLLILSGLILLCIVIVAVCRCREMKADWREKQPPRFREYLVKVFETILEFFD